MSDNTDCLDMKNTVYQGAPERCNTFDDNCNGLFDEDVKTTYYCDHDQDGYGDPAVTTLSCWKPHGYVENSSDCDNNDPAVHPGAAEVLNGIDDDCDGLIDEDFMHTYYRDADGDSYGDPADSTQALSAPEGYVDNSADCDDADAAVRLAEKQRRHSMGDDKIQLGT